MRDARSERSLSHERPIEEERANLDEIMDFQPTVHQLYEEELFPDLEFSRKYSANS